MNLNDLFTEEKVRLDPKCWTGKKIGNPKTKMKGGTRVNNCVPAESVNEMDKSQTPPGRDGSNDSDAGKKEYTAKPTTAKKVAKDAEKVLNKELNKKQGVAEGFPHDVDHMPGPVIRNADMTTDNVKTKDKAEWDRATDSINARVFDDMSEFRTDSKGETVVGDSAVWAKWDNATQTGWFNAKGRPLKPWPIKEQGVPAESVNEKSVSQAQFRTMAAAAHNPEFAKKVGISQDVAKEFHSADKNSNYKKLPNRTNEEGERGRGRPMAGDWDPTAGKVGRVEKTPTGVRHHADPSRYGGTEQEPELDALNKNTINAMDRALGVKWDRESKKYFSPLKVDMDEGEQQKGADYRDPPEADYGDDYQDMVARVKKLAGLGPLKTVYDPAKRVYRNMPTAVQPKR